MLQSSSRSAQVWAGERNRTGVGIGTGVPSRVTFEWPMAACARAPSAIDASAVSPWPCTHSGSGPSSGRPVKNFAAMHPPRQASKDPQDAQALSQTRQAREVFPDPDTPTTATVGHSGTSTSTSLRLLCRAPRKSMTAGRACGAESCFGPRLTSRPTRYVSPERNLIRLESADAAGPNGPKTPLTSTLAEHVAQPRIRPYSGGV